MLQSLDTLGAGFQLASHDLDIRGAGNLLGEEQSGHIKEVGFELYQQMLEEAVASLKAGGEDVSDERWSPQITIGMAVMIPEDYVPDLQLRMSLYRRLADLDDAAEIDAFGAELIDRFGPLPEEVEHLLKIVFVKALCRRANVEKVDAGPKGAVIAFRNNDFRQPAGADPLDRARKGLMAKIRPDQRVVFIRDWENAGGAAEGRRGDPDAAGAAGGGGEEGGLDLAEDQCSQVCCMGDRARRHRTFRSSARDRMWTRRRGGFGMQEAWNGKLRRSGQVRRSDCASD